MNVCFMLGSLWRKSVRLLEMTGCAARDHFSCVLPFFKYKEQCGIRVEHFIRGTLATFREAAAGWWRVCEGRNKLPVSLLRLWGPTASQ